MAGRKIILCLLITCFIGCVSSINIQTNKLRDKKAKVHSLISIGDDIYDSESVLRKSGYKLTYDTAKHVTDSKNYVLQIVQVGSGTPTTGDILFYTLTGGDNPFRLESDYIVIEAGNDGIITRVE